MKIPNVNWIRNVNLRITDNEDKMLKTISINLGLSSPKYNESLTIRRCIKLSYDQLPKKTADLG